MMAQEFAKRFYNSKVWKECRASFIAVRIAIDGGMCMTCHKELGYIVHHMKWLTPDNINDPVIALNHDNLKYDCQTCHNQEKEGKEQEQPRYYFGESGEVILIKPIEEE
ncbi:MAG: HNH endonuclease [Mobilitalea sp.]